VYLEAIALFERALADSPDDADLHLKYGYLIECHARTRLRLAVAEYERAIELDPQGVKAHYQLIGARAGLREPELAIAIYEQRLADQPEDVEAHRLLVSAYLSAHDFEQAARVAEAGLALAPDDSRLIEDRGDVQAGRGNAEAALADWRLAHELDPDSLSSIYSSAFLLEREGRPEQAIEQWRHIIHWCEHRGCPLESEWPKRELARLTAPASADGG
jgi:tetratricopeptide (TPR) repeat protein